MRGLLLITLAGLSLAVALLLAAASGWLGTGAGPGLITITDPIATSAGAEPVYGLAAVAGTHGEPANPIVFGDTRVHTDLSDAAFFMSLPATGGSGTASLGDACDYARFCSAIDFWVAADYAPSLSQSRWTTTVETLQQCNIAAGHSGGARTRAFAGYYLPHVDPFSLNAARTVWLPEDNTPVTAPVAPAVPDSQSLASLPLATRIRLLLTSPTPRTADFLAHSRGTRADALCADTGTATCRHVDEAAAAIIAKSPPAGARTIVAGTTLGTHVAAHAEPDVTLDDPSQLFEIMSGHGSAEVYRPFVAANRSTKIGLTCPPPSADYHPACWQAGEIVRQRCAAGGVAEERCRAQAAAARTMYLAFEPGGHRIIGDNVGTDWADAGQCRDCFLPAFNYRPTGSAQYLLATRDFAGATPAERRYLGFVGSSASHRARPGNGYKETQRPLIADVLDVRDAVIGDIAFGAAEPERQATSAQSISGQGRGDIRRAMSFRYSGALTAVHAPDRTTASLLAAIDARHTYATSGERILLWFHLDNAGRAPLPMGSRIAMTRAPRFRVSAAGALKQLPGCPQPVSRAVPEERLAELCRNDCYHPADDRKLISRIEVVRIRPQLSPDEPIESLIDDPWLTHTCQPDPLGCQFSFTDDDYAAGERDTTYYVRAVQAPSLAINGGGLNCEYDDDGRCIALTPCPGQPGNPDCLAPVEERAWASPIYVEWDE